MAFMESDKKLDADLNKATSFEDIRSLLENSVTRSGIAERDPESGRFVRREPLTPAAQTAEPAEPHVITKTVNIAGKEIEFSASTELELEQAIHQANQVAEILKTNEPTEPTEPLVRDLAREVLNRNEAEELFRAGAITTAEFLQRTNAVEDYLQERGFDVDKAAGQQFEQSWAQATEQFLHSPAGADWPGGQKNLELIGTKIMAMNLIDAPDKVAALTQAYEAMKKSGTLFDSDYSPEQLNQLTVKASPQEILQAWKESQADPEAANAEFIERFRGGRSSAIFGR